MYFDGVSFRRVAENVEAYFDRPTNAATVYRWVQELSERADGVARGVKIPTGREWVADEMAVRLGGRQYWLFNVMDADSRFLLAAYLSPWRTSQAAATALSLARERAANAPKEIKTDGLPSYNEGIRVAFPVHGVRHVVTEGIKAAINNNLSERLQGTLRDRDKVLRGLKKPESAQTYLDGLVFNYNYIRPHHGLDGKRPAEAAGAELPFRTWREVAEMKASH